MVPFLSDLLVWSRQSMPQAVANPSPSPGVSPGLMPIMGKTYTDKFATLPVLFTIDRQQLGPRLTELAAIIAIANNARDLPTFVNGLVRHVLDRLSDGGNVSAIEVYHLFRGWQNLQLPANLVAGIVAAITDDLPAPRLPAQGQGIVATRLVPFVNALIQDVVTLGRVMLASGNYHTMPPVAFTFLLDRRS
jgi:hypothetical protein